ncbi:MAG: DEAD/DEAH box helicase family protein [Muribaculaceae bacterium]|nr:DEAD/DEAH box helicase family protein [Muribaculaceae bacterium]
MKDLAYQRKAVEQLTDSVIDLLNEGGLRRKVVFEAPTGSGKTVITSMALKSIVERLKSDGTSQYSEVAFIWFAPRRLHLQSYLKLKDAYADGRELTPVRFDSNEPDEGIQSGTIHLMN